MRFWAARYLDRRAKISFLWPVRVSSSLSRKEWEWVRWSLAIASEVGKLQLQQEKQQEKQIRTVCNKPPYEEEEKKIRIITKSQKRKPKQCGKKEEKNFIWLDWIIWISRPTHPHQPPYQKIKILIADTIYLNWSKISCLTQCRKKNPKMQFFFIAAYPIQQFN